MKLGNQTVFSKDRAARLASALKASSPAPGRYGDGRNLWLLVSPTGAKSWLFIYRAANGKQRELGLGSFTGKGSTVSVGLKAARLAADKVRVQLSQGIDPIDAKKAAKKAALAASATLAKRGNDGAGIDARLAELRSRKPELAGLLERQIDALLKTADEPLGDVVNSAQPKSELPKKRRVGRPAKPLPTHLQVIADREA
ncbi:Arm DNA-binding domain-containing protein [Mesorhizobium sp. B1-1-6]|uniref:Arm DNA-binding domain-containing protein n=1 Tax=Mesorhizobium sp. B1-1-6 TaxID=2589978 RepID=UPI00112AE219|nr:Arm DNA-binding domain-containing protein [Mesorhizobium sp. B1-1-6]TPN41382.1 DUF4102 domain-containing protein [Mesorhizobium sp. B1-1-6]